MKNVNFKFGDLVDKSIERFIKNQSIRELSEEEIKQRAELKRELPSEKWTPHILSGENISSEAMNTYLREGQLRINILASQTTSAENTIKNACLDLQSILYDINNETQKLNADIQELEIQAEGKYNTVHLNSFVRARDLQDTESMNLSQDWKTNQVFRPKHYMRVLSNAGLTLPVHYENEILIRNIQIVDEETDVGNTRRPLVESDPNDLLNNKSFKYIIARRKYDETGQLYNYTETQCKLLIELHNIQIINFIEIGVSAACQVFLKEVAYVNESGENVSLESEIRSIDGSLKILLEPIKTNNIYLTFVSYSPLLEDQIYTDSELVAEMNNLLKASDWSTKFPSNETSMECRIFDLSIQSIKLSSIAYRNLGMYQSQPLPVQSLLSASLSVNTESIPITSQRRAYSVEHFLPESVVTYESYLRILLEDKNKKKQIESLIPMPSQKSSQIELLPLTRDECKLQFMPDLFYSSTRLRVYSASYNNNFITVTLEKDHGITQGITFSDQIEIWAGKETPRKNTTSVQWSAISSNELRLKRNDLGALESFIAEIGPNDSPQAFILRNLNSMPFTVYEEGKELSLGEDYIYSLNNGVTWHSTILTLEEYNNLYDIAIAGNFRIKIINPDYSKFYWITYQRLQNQFLHDSKLFGLRNSVVVFSPKLKQYQGTVSIVLISRASSRIPYITDVIQNYILKVRAQ